MKHLRTYEVAKKLECSQRTVRRLLNQGKLEGYKISGTWRIEPDEIQGTLEQKKRLSPKISQ